MFLNKSHIINHLQLCVGETWACAGRIVLIFFGNRPQKKDLLLSQNRAGPEGTGGAREAG